MLVHALVSAATDLATSVGPRATLCALEDLRSALDAIDAELWESGDGCVIDLRETRAVLSELQPLLARTEVRVADLRSAMRGR